MPERGAWQAALQKGGNLTMTEPKEKRTYLVTGGAGFIGSNLVHYLVSLGHRAVVIDKLTYAGNKASLAGISPEMLRFEQIDICDTDAVSKLICKKS